MTLEQYIAEEMGLSVEETPRPTSSIEELPEGSLVTLDGYRY